MPGLYSHPKNRATRLQVIRQMANLSKPNNRRTCRPEDLANRFATAIEKSP